MSDATEMTEMTSMPATTQGTVATLAAAAAQRFAEHVAARYKSAGEWHELTFAQVSAAVDDRAGPGQPRHRRRRRWRSSPHAAGVDAGQGRPRLPDHSPKECAWVLGNSGSRAVFCETEAQRAKIDQVRDELPDLMTTIGIEDGAGESTLVQLRERGRGGDRSELQARQGAVTREDPYTIIYTSGTTGPPQGVVLSHGNAMSVGELVQQELDRANSNYAQVEQIKKFVILERDLSIEDGELTPTLKVKPNVVNERFADRFDSLYR